MLATVRTLKKNWSVIAKCHDLRIFQDEKQDEKKISTTFRYQYI